MKRVYYIFIYTYIMQKLNLSTIFVAFKLNVGTLTD